MTRGHSASRGLLSRVTRIGLVIGTVTVLAAIGIALSSQSRLTTINIKSRDTMLVQTLEERIQSRLHTINTMMEKATVGTSGVKADLLERLQVVFSSSPSHLDSLLVADRSGNLLLALSDGEDAPDSARQLPAFVAAASGKTGFITVHHDETRWELWLVRTTVDQSGKPLYILARADTAFLGELVESVAGGTGRRSIVVLDGSRALASNSRADTLDLDRAIWSSEDGYVGKVTVSSTEGQALQGHFRDVGVLEGVGWRILIVEPRATAYLQVVTLVLPLVGVLMIGGVVALLSAWGLSLGMTKPLHDLQRAARSAAAGSYVRPLVITRDDEIGEVALAFNAVALRLNALHDLSQLLASASRLDQVLDGILAAVGHLVEGGAVGLYLLEGGETYVPVRTRGRELATAKPVSANQSAWFAKALEDREPLEFSGDAGDLQRQLPGYKGEDVSTTAVPLIAHGDPQGMVVIARHSSRPFSEAELEMLRTFSAQASVAIHTSRLFEHESESRRVAEALRNVAEELVRPERMEETLRAIEEIIQELFSAKEARIILSHPSTVGLEPSTREGDAELLALALEALAKSNHAGQAILRVGDTMQADALLDRISADRCFILAIAPESDHPAVMAVMLSSRDLGIGEQEAALAIAREVALSLDNAYFYQRALNRADNLENIFHISQAVGSSLQINVVLNRVLEVVQKLLNADALALMSYDPLRRKLSMSMGRGALPQGLTQVELKSGEDIPGEVFQRGEPVALRSMRPEMGGVAGMSASVGLRSLLAVPLLARGRSIGVLMVFATHEGGFAEEDVKVLRTFAFQAALAIDTARLYGREHEVADVLQRSILPEALPELPELELGSVYAPAGENIDIGGDYYDVFRTPDNLIWIAIGDVCGKGIHAATKTSMIKYVVRALATAGLEPSHIISQANDMISNTGEASDIVTLWVGRYDSSQEGICWANGGHPPAIVRRRKGEIEELGPTGPLLGAQWGAQYEQIDSKLADGDMLLLYTDGVSEARSGSVFFGVGRIQHVLKASKTPSDAARSLLASVRDYTQGELRDDVAVLAVAPRTGG